MFCGYRKANCIHVRVVSCLHVNFFDWQLASSQEHRIKEWQASNKRNKMHEAWRVVFLNPNGDPKEHSQGGRVGRKQQAEAKLSSRAFVSQLPGRIDRLDR